MPCYDPRNREDQSRLSSRVSELSGMLCALMTELSKRDDFKQIVNRAEENGRVDIKTFWRDHIKIDEERLKKDLEERYSSDEIEVIRRLLQ